MGRTFTDFSQLSKGMFRKGEPVVEKKAADLERQLAEERAARQTQKPSGKGCAGRFCGCGTSWWRRCKR